jgi:hypothetical protein
MRRVAGGWRTNRFRLNSTSAFSARPSWRQRATVLRSLQARLRVHRRQSAPPLSTLRDGSTNMLADFVSQTKNRYLQDVKDGKGGNWIVVMGNEAGGE